MKKPIIAKAFVIRWLQGCNIVHIKQVPWLLIHTHWRWYDSVSFFLDKKSYSNIMNRENLWFEFFLCWTTGKNSNSLNFWISCIVIIEMGKSSWSPFDICGGPSSHMGHFCTLKEQSLLSLHVVQLITTQTHVLQLDKSTLCGVFFLSGVGALSPQLDAAPSLLVYMWFSVFFQGNDVLAAYRLRKEQPPVRSRPIEHVNHWKNEKEKRTKQCTAL